MTAQRSCGSILLLAALFCSVFASGEHPTDDFALELLDNGDLTLAKALAQKHGFDLLHHAHQLGNVYHLRHRTACKRLGDHSAVNECARDAAALTRSLAAHPRVLRAVHQTAEEVDRKWLPLQDLGGDDDDGEAEDQIEVESKEAKTTDDADGDEEDAAAYKKALSLRKLGLVVNDPKFHMQWYMVNTGQVSGINPGLDLNLLPVWNKGIFGSGVVVTVVDDGIDVNNPDLGGFDPLASADLNNLTNQAGVPIRFGKLTMRETHGTACAGEIGAAANNSFCGIGAAFKANVGGIRILDGIVTDLLEAYAILHNNQYISIYSCSWGPKDNGWKMDMPKMYTSRALKLGVERGRRGKGSIFVMASGNGGRSGDNCGADGFVNSPYTVAVGALNIYGKTPLYGESCSAIHVAVPVGGRDSEASPRRPDPLVTTTMVNGGCFSAMSGTSAATPLVSACVALALEANPDLTWRDVQHLLAKSARLPSAEAGTWQVNAAGLHVSHHAGFGLLDCARLVFGAQTWKSVPEMLTCRDALPVRRTLHVPEGRPLTITFTSTGCKGTLTRVEHALVTLSMSGGMRRGDIEIWLVSPSGTKARLLGGRRKDNDRKLGIRRQTFLSLLTWDENPAGQWLLRVKDRSGRSGAAVTGAELKLTGTGGPPVAPEGARGHWMSASEAAATFRRERLESAGREVLHPGVALLSKRLTDALADASPTGVERLEQVVGEAKRVVGASGGGVSDWDLKFLLGQISAALGS